MAVQKLLLVLTILISTCIFALCWGFTIIIWRLKYVILPDSVVNLVTRYPTVLTLVSTVISTILSVITTFLLSFTVKKAINHYITRPISLAKLHTAIALTKPQPLLQWNHYKLSIFTLIFVCLVTLLNSSWTTLLLPTLLLWPVPISGTDLDLASSAFDVKLGDDDTNMSGNYMNGCNVLEIMASMSGTSATRSAVAGGSDSVFAFNGVSYNISSGGVLPAVEDYAGTKLPPGDIGLAYYGGKVAVYTSLVKDRGRSGLARNYTVTQQGLSAIVTCSDLSDLDPNKFSLNFTSTNSSTTAWWQGTASCPLGTGVGNWSTAVDEGIGFLGIVVCPTPVFVNGRATSFDILLQGMGSYNLLDATVCNVAPYVASFDVTYNQTMISVDQHQTRNIQPLQSNVTALISAVVNMLSISSQATSTNPLALLLLLSSLDPTSLVNETLQNYFRGVVEFSGTYLRSAYSAEGANVSSTMQDLYSDKNAFKSLNGTMFITTYGWYRGHLTYIYILVVFTVIWAVTVSAAAYSLIQECTHPHTGPTFDASNPVHLMMASSAGGLETLTRFENNGALENERTRVRLLDGRDVVPDDAVGEKTYVRPTRSTMPRFEIVP
ncbi:uncharacterized protein BJ212DRAFT_1481065 [Suillus subaureus]|uniref:Uncharacterized protein n=1 Tax=Suillus subaureus TaxID=48587 RepID=A0A9P7EAV7_9AGAM|nr:uncharacterized protein BJ212DRAFT_1481065 [Suillus subaureus]KAG1816002.1 hypothetical protein BJ212DRAFT_1481065 [Suillus subaureus]